MRIYRRTAVLLSFLFFFTLMSAESIENTGAGKMPVINIPEPPQMPEITVSSVGSPFYKPDLPLLKKNKNPEEKKDSVQTVPETVLSPAVNSTDVLSSLLHGSSALSAKDIESLSDIGLFSSMSSLDGYDYYTNLQSTTTETLLRQILASLDVLKKQQANISESEINEQKEISKDCNNFKSRNPSVLRFRINGYDISPSLATVFFSNPEEDGSFLLTGDRKYYADKKYHSETFYVLFKAQKASNGAVQYKLTPSIVQDSRNENSFLYQMAQKDDLIAEKTGNLVTVHYLKNNWKMDLLLDIDCMGGL